MVAILDFENLEFLLANGVRVAELHQHAKLHQNWLISCGDIAIF